MARGGREAAMGGCEAMSARGNERVVSLFWRGGAEANNIEP